MWKLFNIYMTDVNPSEMISWSYMFRFPSKGKQNRGEDLCEMRNLCRLKVQSCKLKKQW